MFAIKNIGGLRKVKAGIMARAEGKLTKELKRYTELILIDVVEHTPQWSGDLAASWQVVVGKPNQNNATDQGYTSFKDIPFRRPALHRLGDPEAGDYAMLNNAAKIDSIRWNSHISIQNLSRTLTQGDPVTNGPLISETQLRPVNIRPDHYIPGDFMAVQYIKAKYHMRLKI